MKTGLSSKGRETHWAVLGGVVIFDDLLLRSASVLVRQDGGWEAEVSSDCISCPPRITVFSQQNFPTVQKSHLGRETGSDFLCKFCVWTDVSSVL